MEGRRLIDGNLLYVVCLRLSHGYLILVTNYDPENALQDYARRWEIENLFSCLKSRGFRFEETHLLSLERIEKLIAILSIALVFAHIMGEWQQEQKKIPIKKHGRKAQSIFRYGLNYLRRVILNFELYKEDFLLACCLFSNSLARQLFCLSNVNFRATYNPCVSS